MKFAIIGDFNKDFRPHVATNQAIEHSRDKFGLNISYDWVSTDSIEKNYEKIISTYGGYWIAPGSPYRNMAGALEIIKFARKNNIPTI